QQERCSVEHYFPGSGIQRGEQLIFREDIRLAEDAHDRAFTHVGIAHQRGAYEFSALLTLCGSLLVYFGEAFPEQGNFILYDPPVRFYLRFSRSPAAYPATLAFQVGPHTPEA